jgi:serine protease
LFFTALCISTPMLLQGLTPADQSNRLANLADLGSKPVVTTVVADHHPLRLEVKFIDGAGVRLIGGSLQAMSAEVFAIDKYLNEIGAVRHRVFPQSDEWLNEFRSKGEARNHKVLHDLTLFYGIELVQQGSVGAVCDALNAYGIVEIAYPLPRVEDPVAPSSALGATPDFEVEQGYRDPAPTGVDADYGNTFSGGSGLGTTVADMETGWTDDHEDLAHVALGNHVGLAPMHYPWDHGTAVLGELVGEDNGTGVRGIVYDADVRMSTHQGDPANIPGAIMSAIAAVGVGDAVLIEAQCYGTPPGPFPCEYVASSFSAIETATANGIHVFAASGNGNNNLDQAAYGGAFDRNLRDSGAVMIGASDGASLNKASFSNYGARLDVHGWGFDVASTGYGDLQGGPVTQEYTQAFSGTSSASPIVTGAGLIISNINKSINGAPLDPFVLRDLLTQSGTPQGSGGNIGPRPDVHAAIDSLNLPRIELNGNLVPGGQYTVTSRGPANAVYALIFGDQLASDRWLSPFGQLFLASPWSRVKSGVLSASGEATFNAMVPNDPALAGTTLGFYQGWQRYAGTNGGSFANFVRVDVE